MPLTPLPAELTERTVPALLRRNAERRCEVTALHASSAYDGWHALSYRELASRSGRLARVLADRGVGKGDRIGILFDNDAAVESHLSYHAAHRIGAINVPLNDRYMPRELDFVVRKSKLAAILFGSNFADKVRQLGAATDGTVLLEASESPVLGADLRALCSGATEAEQVEVGENDDADWIFTSGTTGNPKGVALTHGNSVACGHQSVRLWGLGADSVYQSSAPFFTSTGSHTNLLAVLVVGCSYVVEPAFDAWETLARIGRYRSTSVFIVSGMLQLILQRVPLDELDRLDLSSWRRLCYGAQPMSGPFYRQVQEVFGDRYGLELLHLYGLTEGGTCGMLLPPEKHAEAVRKAGPHGLTIGDQGFNEWVRYRVADGDGNLVSPGEVGEIQLRGPSVMDRYVDEPEATEAALRGEWLHTKDMATVDEDGFVYFVDRHQQIIRRGGLNISSSEVEGVLAHHPVVQEAAVIARKNPILGQEPCAVVVLKDNQTTTETELSIHCAALMADYKVPVYYRFVAALPKNSMGRVIKGELTDLL